MLQVSCLCIEDFIILCMPCISALDNNLLCCLLAIILILQVSGSYAEIYA